MRTGRDNKKKVLGEIAILSDVHSNLEAFTAALEYIDQLGIKRIYSLGDTVGYGPNPVECTKLATKHCEVRLMGNHEYALKNPDQLEFNPEATIATNWTRDRLEEAGILNTANELPIYLLESDVLFVHGS